MRIGALILAAGFSSRMGEFKPLLPIGDKTALEHCIGNLSQGGAETVVVVVGHRGKEITPLLSKRGIQWVENQQYEKDVFSSVQVGVRCLADENIGGFFVLPVDIPLVRKETIKTLIAEFKSHPDQVIHPVFRNLRGHPPLIPVRLIPEILTWNKDGGLRGFLRGHEDGSVNTAVIDRFSLMDMDTPEDYNRMLSAFSSYAVPSIEECREMMENRFCVNEKLKRHCMAVGFSAHCIGKALNSRGLNLNLMAMVSGGLLHDLFRERKNHAEVCADYMEALGFANAAGIVRTHMDITIDTADPVTEKEVVYLSDKLVKADGLVGIEKRFDIQSGRFAGDPAAEEAMRRRYQTACMIKERLEILLQKPVENIIAGEGEIRFDFEYYHDLFNAARRN